MEFHVCDFKQQLQRPVSVGQRCFCAVCDSYSLKYIQDVKINPTGDGLDAC